MPAASTNIVLKRRNCGILRMDEPNQKKDEDARITEKLPNRFVVVMLHLLYQGWYLLTIVLTEFISDVFCCVFGLCCFRTHHSNQPDHKESENSTDHACYLGCLTKRWLIVICVCVGLFILILVSAVTAVVITKKSGTCWNQIKSVQKK